MLGVNRSALALVLGAVVLALMTAAGRARPTARPAAPTAASHAPSPDSLTGTVRYVREGGIDVITGVQFALKLTYIAVDSATVIRKQGASIAMDTLQPGDLVTVHYRETERGKVAQSVVVHPPRREDRR